MAETYIPRPFQPLITNYALDNPRCGIWAGVGFGKTAGILQALSILEIVEPGPALVVAPPRVAHSTWTDARDKWEDFHHLQLSCLIGTPDQRSQALRRKANIYTISNQNLPWLVERLKNDWPFRKVIWDESAKLRGLRCSEQTSPLGKKFIRVAGSQRLRGIARIAHSKIDRFIELTGTPSPNGLKNLWGQAWMLDKGRRLGHTYERFMERWFSLSYDGYTVKPLPHAEKEIHERLNDICMSLNLEDWFDVEKPSIIPLYVNLPPKVMSLYKDMEKKLFIKIKNKEIEAFNAGSRTMKCRQIASGFAYHNIEFDDGEEKEREWTFLHNEKIEVLESVIEENKGTPIIIVYDFKPELDRLKKAFPHGRHLRTKKDEDDFKAGRIELLFMHFKSAAEGIDGFQYITNIMVIMNPDWNLEDLDQGIGRIGPVRQFQAGLNRGTFVYPIVAQGTVEEDVLERWKTKRSVQDILLEAMKKGV